MSEPKKDIDPEIYERASKAGEAAGRIEGYAQAKNELQGHAGYLVGAILIALLAGALGFILGVGVFAL